MSKLNKELVDKAVDTIIQFSNGETVTKEGKEIPGKKRKFTESIELQARTFRTSRALSSVALLNRCSRPRAGQVDRVERPGNRACGGAALLAQQQRRNSAGSRPWPHRGAPPWQK